MNNVAGAILLIALLLLPFAIVVIVWVLKAVTGRVGHGKYIAAVISILVVSAVAIVRLTARPVHGIVREKTEQIQFARTSLLPSVLHVLRITVLPVDSSPDSGVLSQELSLALDPVAYDRLIEGQAVDLSESRLGPVRFARLADAAWWHVLPLHQMPEFETEERTAATTARVISIRTVRKALLRPWYRPRSTVVFPLPQAYDEVTLRLDTNGGVSEALTIDRIDSGSVQGLSPGLSVHVTYSKSNIRDARLVGAQRTYAWSAYRARMSAVLPQIIGAVSLAFLVGVGLWRLTRRKK